MRIVYFYQYFCTPKGSWGTRVYEFAKRWVAQGHQVTVVTSVYYKSDLKKGKGLVSRYTVDGIDVIQLNIEINNKQGILKRIQTFIGFALLSSFYALKLRADVVVASSGPITAGIPGLVARYLRRRKLVFEVRDLWPDGAIEMGLLNQPILQRIAYALEKRCYRAAKHIVTLSPGMSDNIRQRLGYTHTTSVPNASDLDLFGATPPEVTLPDWARQKKLALYTGNVGVVNNSELLLEAARSLQQLGRTDIQVVLIGDGQLKAKLLEESKDVDTFTMVGVMPKTELVAWVRQSMVMLVPLRGTPVLDTSSPNKLFEALSASTPVIQTTQGWLKTLLEEYEAGYTVDANDPQPLVERLIAMADHPERVEQMGSNARSLAEKEFNREVLSQRMLEVLQNAHSS
ncbi:MAG TPA: glycosyltransferase WbuB [Cytophagales bacterium]|nr:glycosyltransferase WbuB [Cytophagales bacterium]